MQKKKKNYTKIFIAHNVDYVFHTAAYKHVSLVEINPIEGIKNNLLTTYSICNASLYAGVKNDLNIFR